MTNEEQDQCRNIARTIVRDIKLLESFKNQIELAAMVDCAKHNDPHPTYDYAYSYEAIIKYLLAFETKLKTEWIDPELNPNGKMTDTSAAEKSKTISMIKGQLRIDRGAKVRDERIAGFYAWMNAVHPVTCAELNKSLLDSLEEDVTLEFPRLLPDISNDIASIQTPNWNKLCTAGTDPNLVRLIDYESFSLNLVEISRPSNRDVEAFKFGDEFLFEINSRYEGHIIALQAYKGKTFALPLSDESGLMVVSTGQNFYPMDRDADEVIPLVENTDMGIHNFIFLLFAGIPPIFDYVPFYRAGEAIHPVNLEALATKLMNYPKRNWQFTQIKVNFR